jgi:predicted RNase H-like HicB family nuclease
MRMKVIIHEADEGGFWAEAPGFRGCVAEGDALEEVRANIGDALEGVLMVMQDKPIEQPSHEANDRREQITVLPKL